MSQTMSTQMDVLRYNPPPNWPTPPEGWTPSGGWVPDPGWGPAPQGWPLWVRDQGPPPRPLLDRPLYRDWISYLYAFSVVASLVSTYKNFYQDGINTSFDLVAFAIDVVAGFAFQALVFLLLPAAIRSLFRKRRPSTPAQWHRYYRSVGTVAPKNRSKAKLIGLPILLIVLTVGGVGGARAISKVQDSHAAELCYPAQDAAAKHQRDAGNTAAKMKMVPAGSTAYEQMRQHVFSEISVWAHLVVDADPTCFSPEARGEAKEALDKLATLR